MVCVGDPQVSYRMQKPMNKENYSFNDYSFRNSAKLMA
jgi:hypothetical protein